MTDTGRTTETRLHPECEIANCPLPIYCAHCRTCLLHCAGQMGWYSALRYFLEVWWRSRIRGQGGWYFDDWYDVFQFWPWMWNELRLTMRGCVFGWQRPWRPWDD